MGAGVQKFPTVSQSGSVSSVRDFVDIEVLCLVARDVWDFSRCCYTTDKQVPKLLRWYRRWAILSANLGDCVANQRELWRTLPNWGEL